MRYRGDTLLELWRKKKGNNLIAHNFYNGWYVLIEVDPEESLANSGKVYGRLARFPLNMLHANIRSILDYDCKYWEEYIIEDAMHRSGDTLFELWRKKKGSKLIAHDIYNDLYVLIEEDPEESFAKSVGSNYKLTF